MENLGVIKASKTDLVRQLDLALHSQGANFKLLHPLLIGKYARMSNHYREESFDTVGLDIETIADTGEPRLMGFAFERGYHKIENPTLQDFFEVCEEMIDNLPGASMSVWGNLDIQCILRLFNPTEDERLHISRGISANFKNGEFVGSPPVVRYMKKGSREIPFYVDHYIAGRSLRLGMVFGKHAFTLWIYNLSQFYQGTISQTAQGLGFDWIEYPRETHVVDWARYESGESEYVKAVVDSNRQDAMVARKLSFWIQETFAEVFDAYPSILVSVGSLADAAVSKWLSAAEYQSNSWRWLSYNVWRDRETTAKAETLLAECFSAGYVDQFAIGYFDSVHMADISAAYPDKIRHLPDLRYSVLLPGSGNIRSDMTRIRENGLRFYTAIMRGTVTIPETLKYHPITVKTPDRQNVRPVGTFSAAYLYEEREFCRQRGASFANEEYVIVALKKESLAPIAKISRRLRTMREGYLDDLKREKDANRRVVLDGMQYLVKIVDNSLYGKTVMTVPIVEDLDGVPSITGYRAGDRFNMLYGSVITARTRIQIAEACGFIESNGGRAILAMTDSIFWTGGKDCLPGRLWRDGKVPGYFEEPEELREFFIIKTGQYEYRQGEKFKHKMRGLNVPFDQRKSDSSYYRRLILDHAKGVSKYLHPDDFAIPVRTRKLVTIGNYDLSRLGLVEDSVSMMKPFVTSGKQAERYVHDWNRCLNGHVWFRQVFAERTANVGETPLEFLRRLYEGGDDYLDTYQRKRAYLYSAVLITEKLPPPGRKLSNMSWKELEGWFGIDRNEIFERLGETGSVHSE